MRRVKKAQQKALNEHGFRDHENKKLKVDGLLGARTLAAIRKCKDWQTWLNVHGFNCGKVDGWPGKKTDAAIRVFQTSQGCAVDGIIGPETTNARKHFASTPKKIVHKIIDKVVNPVVKAVFNPLVNFINSSRRYSAVVVHYSYSNHGNVAVIDSWHRARGWSNGCGYDAVVGNGNGLEDGAVEFSDRYLKGKAGAHTRGWNTRAFGICYIGTSYPTDAQMKTIISLTSHVKHHHAIRLERIFGHKDVGNTSCPGELIVAQEVRPKL